MHTPHEYRANEEVGIGTAASGNSIDASLVDSLIARLEKASGPDRELDVAIGLTIPEPTPFNATTQVLRNGKPSCPEFTESVDEALTLIPPSHTTSIHNGANEPETFPCTFSISQYHDGFSATIYYDTYPTWNIDRKEIGEAWAGTAALAICSAALKARKYIGGAA